MRVTTYILFILSIGIFSCTKDTESADLDAELKAALEASSDGNGPSHFKIVDPNNLSALPQDPNNPITIDKVELGKNLYHETAFAIKGKFEFTDGEFSCATCHHVGAGFQAGIAQGLGEGGEGFGMNGEGRTRNLLCDPALCDVQPIRTPTVLNGGYQELMLWNGQFGSTGKNIGTESKWTEGTPKAINHLGFEGIETQAIAGLAVHRMGFGEEAVTDFGYKEAFDEVFADVPPAERYTAITAGLAIAAYERTIVAYEAPFQKYLRGNTLSLSDYQKEGAILFFGKAGCVTCHTGPALNKMEFHALGLNEFDPSEVTHYDPSNPTRFGRGSFTADEADMYKFKTPQLYNLKGIGFLGHGASIHSVADMIEYKNRGVAENTEVPESQLAKEFKPLGLTSEEVDKITAFVEKGLYDNNLSRYVPGDLPSGNCFPNNDGVSQEDLGCR